MGFYELRGIGIPSVKWEEYKPDSTILDDNHLWTIRTAITKGNDLNLPRLIGVKSDEASKFANEIYKKYNGEALIVYYPYFIANKSGTVEVKYNGYVIESVQHDLWNLVTENKCDQTIISEYDEVVIKGKENFLTDEELKELLKSIKIIRHKFASLLRDGNSILLEWSFAVDTDKNKQTIGEEYLVFYECRML